MIDLKKITKGREQRPPKLLVYGAHGVGKTPWAASAPDAFFIDTDRGSHKYDVAQRVVPESWTEVQEWLSEIEAGRIKCQSVVIDSVTQLEAIGHKEFFKDVGVGSWAGGYGRGDDHAIMKWREMVAQLERVWRSGKTVILCGHSTVKKFEAPEGPAYERYVLAMRGGVAGLLSQWVDFILFAKETTTVQPVGPKGKEKSQVISLGVRKLYSKWTPAYDAKARGLFPDEILMDWPSFEAAVASDALLSTEVGQQIETMLAELGDETVAKNVRENLKKKPSAAIDARNWLGSELEKKRAGVVVAAQPAAATGA